MCTPSSGYELDGSQHLLLVAEHAHHVIEIGAHNAGSARALGGAVAAVMDDQHRAAPARADAVADLAEVGGDLVGAVLLAAEGLAENG